MLSRARGEAEGVDVMEGHIFKHFEAQIGTCDKAFVGVVSLCRGSVMTLVTP